MNRVILHVDLDYFYAQLEELRHPELRGKPIAVCMFSGRTETSGAVATSNYQARALGVKAGMPIAFAKKAAPQAAFLPADREHYSQVSERIMGILVESGAKFEQAGIDEAYIDASDVTGGSYAEAKKIALRLKSRILDEEGLTCSVGIGPNKLIAKMASGHKKPDGLTAVAPAEVREFLRGKRISDLHGVGEKTVETLAKNGIRTIQELAAAPVTLMQELFGENRGILIHDKALGIDESPVEEKAPQQFSRIMTLKEDATNAEAIIAAAGPLAEQLAGKASAEKLQFRTVAVILISKRLETIARSRTIAVPSPRAADIMREAEGLFRQFFAENPGFAARRFGLRISGLEGPKSQKSIFEFS